MTDPSRVVLQNGEETNTRPRHGIKNVMLIYVFISIFHNLLPKTFRPPHSPSCHCVVAALCMWLCFPSSRVCLPHHALFLGSLRIWSRQNPLQSVPESDKDCKGAVHHEAPYRGGAQRWRVASPSVSRLDVRNGTLEPRHLHGTHRAGGRHAGITTSPS